MCQETAQYNTYAVLVQIAEDNTIDIHGGDGP